jgi:hypothetical protein
MPAIMQDVEGRERVKEGEGNVGHLDEGVHFLDVQPPEE